jgi:hypothetical protein
MQTTVIYYTSNREEESFEKVIREKLLEVIGDLPLISVSQKPIDFGDNICVGDVGISNQNAHRQLQIGATMAKTPFIHAAEADCLYPPEYFKFIPPVLDRAYRTPIYLLNLYKGIFKKKLASESATVVGRDYLIKMIDRSLARFKKGVWNNKLEHGSNVPVTFRRQNYEIFKIKNPIVNIKTKFGMHQVHGTVGKADFLPYWGTPQNVRRLFHGNKTEKL